MHAKKSLINAETAHFCAFLQVKVVSAEYSVYFIFSSKKAYLLFVLTRETTLFQLWTTRSLAHKKGFKTDLYEIQLK